MSGPFGSLGLRVLSGHMGCIGFLNVEGFQKGLQHQGGLGDPCVLKGHGSTKDLGGPRGLGGQRGPTTQIFKVRQKGQTVSAISKDMLFIGHHIIMAT